MIVHVQFDRAVPVSGPADTLQSIDLRTMGSRGLTVVQVAEGIEVTDEVHQTSCLVPWSRIVGVVRKAGPEDRPCVDVTPVAEAVVRQKKKEPSRESEKRRRTR